MDIHIYTKKICFFHHIESFVPVFKLEFTSSKAGESLRGMKLQETEKEKG